MVEMATDQQQCYTRSPLNKSNILAILGLRGKEKKAKYEKTPKAF